MLSKTLVTSMAKKSARRMRSQDKSGGMNSRRSGGMNSRSDPNNNSDANSSSMHF